MPLQVLDRPFPSPEKKVTTALQKAPAQSQVAQHRVQSDDRLPESPELEKAVLSSIFANAKTGFSTFERLGRRSFFANPVHRELYELGKKFYDEKGTLDLIGFTLHLDQLGRLKSLNAGNVTDLFSPTAPLEEFDYYLHELRLVYLRRQIIKRSFAQAKRARNEDVVTLLTDLEQSVADLKRAAGGPNGAEDFGYDQLMEFDSTRDPNNLVGNRYLVRGGICLWAGPSGAGKSTLEMQIAVYWAFGIPVFGIRPVRPLKSLIVEQENDFGDMAEQLQGVRNAMKAASNELTVDQHFDETVKEKVILKRIIGYSGDRFLPVLETAILMERPDMVWIDPLHAFAGCDLLDARAIGYFIREQLIPLANKHRVCINVIHHISKSAKDTESKSEWSNIDYQYLGFGSSEIQNAFRAVNILLPVSGYNDVYRLELSKRGRRAAARSVNGKPTTTLFLQQSDQGIFWEQVEKPGKEKMAKYDDGDILEHMSVIHGVKANDLQKRVKEEAGMPRATFWRMWKALKRNGKIRTDQEDLWYSKPVE